MLFINIYIFFQYAYNLVPTIHYSILILYYTAVGIRVLLHGKDQVGTKYTVVLLHVYEINYKERCVPL